MDLRDLERRATRGDKTAALRIYYARMSEGGRRSTPYQRAEYLAHVPKLGQVKIRPVGADSLIVEGATEYPGREGHFSLYGVPLRLSQTRYSFYPAHPELGWTTLSEGGVKRLEEHGPDYVSDYYYNERVWLYRADRLHEDASGAAKKKVREALDPAVNAWVKSFGASIQSAELRSVRDRAERLFEDIKKKRAELEALESQAAELTVEELRLESRGVRES